ncbi:hypothetical protein [Massilia sp. TWR1-2-2]|uniref:hypothetical protein n=1 Tax=Massilia sp. TWR1-2-2 TaxID=2804584 RepID=UPI003CE858D1
MHFLLQAVASFQDAAAIAMKRPMAMAPMPRHTELSISATGAPTMIGHSDPAIRV